MDITLDAVILETNALIKELRDIKKRAIELRSHTDTVRARPDDETDLLRRHFTEEEWTNSIKQV